MQKTPSYLMQINLAVVLFGLSGVIGKDIALPAVLVTLGRVIFSSLVLFIMLKVNKQELHLASLRDGLIFLGSGILLAAHWTAFIGATKTSSVAIGVITGSTFPLFATFLEPLFFPEKLKKGNILFAIIIILGVMLLIPPDGLTGNVALGVVYGMFASFSYSSLSLINRGLGTRYNGFVISFYQQGIAAVVLLPTLACIPFTATAGTIGELFLFGVVFTAIAHSLFINGLRGVTVQTASILCALEVVYGLLWAFMLLGEVPTIREILGGIIIVTTAVLSSLYKQRGQAAKAKLK